MKEDPDLTKHKEHMLAYMIRHSKKKRHRLPPPPPPGNGKFEILTANKHELDKEFVRKKIRQTEVRTMAFEMDLARIREDLIEKDLAMKQLSYLVIAMRQKVLAMPTTYARKFLHKSEIKEVHAILKQIAYELLKELKDLPLKVTDPNWMDKLDEEN